MKDTDILNKLTSRSPEAFKQLYQHFALDVRRYLLTIIHNRLDVEDLVQEVFVQIWRHAPSYRAELGSPRTWIIRIARNRAIDYLRSRQYRQTCREVEVIEDSDPGALSGHATGWDEPIVHWERTIFIHEALTHLPQEHRSLIELAFYQGYTHREISYLKGLPLGTVKTRIRNGIQTLRNRLGFLAEEVQIEAFC